jgi:hypothetical protein
MAATHQCPAPKCNTQVPNSMLSCRPHWYGLPRALRDEVWQTAHLSILDEARADVLDRVITYYADRGW